MTQITLKGTPIQTSGTLPQIGLKAPDFTLTQTDLSERALQDFSGKTVLLNIFPSLDTSVCAQSVKTFNQIVTTYADVIVLCISADLPFAHKRFCETDNIKNVISLSCFRHPEFGKNYGLTITSGPLNGLLSRAIVLINAEGKITYTEQVPEIAQEPNYEKALAAVKRPTHSR